MNLTDQQIFDAVWAGLGSQGFKQSVTADGECRYRTVNGDGEELRCAAGHILPDEAYDAEAQEGHSIDGVTWFLENFPRASRLLLRDLQNAHDGVETGFNDTVLKFESVTQVDMTAEVMKQRLRAVAAHHNLKVPE